MVKIDFRKVDGAALTFLRMEINAVQQHCTKGTITASGVIEFLKKWRRILAGAYPCTALASWSWTININAASSRGKSSKGLKSTLFSLKFAGRSDVAFLYNFRRGAGSDMRFLIEPDPMLGSARDRFEMRTGVHAGSPLMGKIGSMAGKQEGGAR